MADKKISALTELTTPADGDKIPIVDVSDTTQAASGTTKFIQKSNLVTGSGGGVWSLLEAVICDSQAYIEFNGDGVNYTNLTDTNFEEFRIVFDAIVPSADGAIYWYVIDNGSRVTSNYSVHSEFKDSGATESDTHYNNAGSQAYVCHAVMVTGSPIWCEIIIPRWDASAKPIVMAEAMFNNNAADFARVKSIGTNDGTLTSIEGISLKRSSGNWGTSGSVKLYGRAA